MAKNILDFAIKTMHDQNISGENNNSGVGKQLKYMKYACNDKYSRHMVQCFENAFSVINALFDANENFHDGVVDVDTNIMENNISNIIINTTKIVLEESVRIQKEQDTKKAQEFLRPESNLDFIILTNLFSRFPKLRKFLINSYSCENMTLAVLKTGHVNYDTYVVTHKNSNDCTLCNGQKCDFCRIRVEYNITSSNGDDIYFTRSLDFCSPLNVFLFNEILRYSEELNCKFTSGQIRQFYSHLTKLETMYSNALMEFFMDIR